MCVLLYSARNIWNSFFYAHVFTHFTSLKKSEIKENLGKTKTILDSFKEQAMLRWIYHIFDG